MNDLLYTDEHSAHRSAEEILSVEGSVEFAGDELAESKTPGAYKALGVLLQLFQVL